MQVIPLHLPPGDTSKERTVQIDGTSEQIEAAKLLVNEVTSEVFLLVALGTVFLNPLQCIILPVWKKWTHDSIHLQPPFICVVIIDNPYQLSMAISWILLLLVCPCFHTGPGLLALCNWCELVRAYLANKPLAHAFVGWNKPH